MTESMRQAIEETERRRAKQLAYNREHGIVPQSVVKAVDMELATIVEADYVQVPQDDPVLDEYPDAESLQQTITRLEAEMREAARRFEFERAARLRDRLRVLRQRQL